MQVELAHGGRGPSSSDRRSGYSGSGGGGGGGGGSRGGGGGDGAGSGRFGISRHSEYRGVSMIWRLMNFAVFRISSFFVLFLFVILF